MDIDTYMLAAIEIIERKDISPEARKLALEKLSEEANQPENQVDKPSVRPSPFKKKNLKKKVYRVKGGFTGQVTDRAGRRQCYANGMHIPCVGNTPMQSPDRTRPKADLASMMDLLKKKPKEVTPTPKQKESKPDPSQELLQVTEEDRNIPTPDLSQELDAYLSKAGDTSRKMREEIKALAYEIKEGKTFQDMMKSEYQSPQYKKWKESIARKEQLEKELETQVDKDREVFLQHFKVGDSNFSYDGEISPQVKEAFDKGINFAASLTKMEEAKFSVSRSDDNRAYYQNNTIYTGGTNDNHASSAAHEIGHFIEEHKPEALNKLKAFIKKRYGDEKFIDVSKFTNGKMTGEMGRKDSFDKVFSRDIDAYYTGKVYYKNGKLVGTEVLSMGLQALYDDPVNMCEKDPEYASFILSLLRE